MRVASGVLALVVSLLTAGSLTAADNEKCQGDKAPPSWSPPLPFLNGLNLTADQKTRLDALRKEYQPKLKDSKLLENILTAQQKTARRQAAEAAKAAGKTPKEIHQAAEAAVTLTADQKAKLAEAKKEMAPIYQEFHAKIMAILTPEQREQLKQRGGKSRPSWSPPFPFLSGLNLTAEQKAKLDALRKEYQPKLQDGSKVMESILTPEQKQAREEARKAARKAIEAARKAAQKEIEAAVQSYGRAKGPGGAGQEAEQCDL